jgi:hypothetical protein
MSSAVSKKFLKKKSHVPSTSSSTGIPSQLNIQTRTNERSLFVRACPDEDCRGFLSSQWKCGIC